jgi:hypothetical protein
MEQLILHLIGDYVTQSDWMALNKRKDSIAALAHALMYSTPFWFLVWHCHRPVFAWWVIFATHFFIDRFGLARYVVWAKNFLSPYTRIRGFGETMDDLKKSGHIGAGPTHEAFEMSLIVEEQKRPIRWNPPWHTCTATGYDPERPAWLAVWLMIAADNTLHLAINYAALRWL